MIEDGDTKCQAELCIFEAVSLRATGQGQLRPGWVCMKALQIGDRVVMRRAGLQAVCGVFA